MLSGGEQQRVALARTVVPRPQVILMDEPFSGLDPQLRWTIRNETLALLRETRATALIVTHDADEAMEMADRIILMKIGEIAQQGTPDEVYRKPATPEVARYFTPMNEFVTVVRNGMVATPVGTFTAANVAEGERALVMFRPRTLVRVAQECRETARVAEVHRRGHGWVVHVRYPGSAVTWTVYQGEEASPRQGEDIALACRPENVLIFKLSD
jgi:iron(III) transport system ATP-binding protein